MILSSAIIVLALVVAFTNEFFQQKMGVSPMLSMPGVRKAMLAEVPEGAKEIVELGSGWGGLAVAAGRAFPNAKIIALEYSLFPYLISRLRPRPANVTFRRADFFDLPLGGASAVLCYLSNGHMARLKEKFLRELPAGARIVSSTFFIPDWPPEKTVALDGLWKTQIFVYRKS